MEADLVARLRADPGVQAASGRIPLGNDTRASVDWIERRSDDAGAFPAAVMQIVSGAGEYDQDGPSGLTQVRLRLRCFADTQSAAVALFAAHRAVLEQSATAGTTRFHRGKLELLRDLPPEDLPDGRRIHTRAGDFRLPFTPIGE